MVAAAATTGSNSCWQQRLLAAVDGQGRERREREFGDGFQEDLQ